MKVSTLNLKATIPTGQYANVIPELEIELGESSYEEARDWGLKHLQDIQALVGEKPLTIHDVTVIQPQSDKLERLTDIDGITVYMNRDAHTYQNKDGVGLLSGSTFAHKFVADFPKDRISGAMASKAGVPQDDILHMWETNAEASTSLGSAIHAALELYGKYKDTSLAVKGSVESVSHNNPFLKAIQKLFYAERLDEAALYEAFVADDELLICGFIDRLLIVDAKRKIARVQDYKTNPNIIKKKDILPPFKGTIENTELGAYWLQLSFYAYILARKGWIIEGLDIFNIVSREQEDGSIKLEMNTYTHDVIDIDSALKIIKGK